VSGLHKKRPQSTPDPAGCADDENGCHVSSPARSKQLDVPGKGS
jgi:hypothetical protein